MSFSFLPYVMLSSITELTPTFFKERDISLLMLDFDNTIVPYTTNVPTPEMDRWLREMAAGEVKLCVVSNSKRDRVPKFCRDYGIECITHAGKPGTGGIRRCLEKFHIPADQAALAGDQIYTDTLGANRAGVRPILVKAINNHNIWLKLRHVAELPFILAARRRKL